MHIPNTLPQFAGHTVLLVVTAKEQGVLYRASEGVVEQVVKVEEHPPTPSDNEGFFFRSGYGRNYGSGGPDAGSGEEELRTFVKSVSEELNEAIVGEQPDIIYFFQPEHFKGYLESELKNPTHIPTHLVKLGNYIHATPLELIEYIRQYHDDTVDPRDPASVADGPDAEEKRRLLSVGQ